MRIDLPFPQGEILDLISEQDREYFENHPTEESYVREAINGELLLGQEPRPYIHVIKFSHFRMRFPIPRPSALYDCAKYFGISVKEAVMIIHPELYEFLDKMEEITL